MKRIHNLDKGREKGETKLAVGPFDEMNIAFSLVPVWSVCHAGLHAVSGSPIIGRFLPKEEQCTSQAASFQTISWKGCPAERGSMTTEKNTKSKFARFQWKGERNKNRNTKRLCVAKSYYLLEAVEGPF